MKAPSNKELERTRSPQTAVGPRRSIQCWTELGTDRMRLRRSEIEVLGSPSWLAKVKRPRESPGVGQVS